jgi:hypothetical protein
LAVKNVGLLTWITQLGLSVAVMPTLIVLLAVYLRPMWGVWILWVGAVLAIWLAVSGFVSSLRMLHRLSDSKKKDTPPLAFNEHD